jgi:hypothetical protein
MQNRLSCCGHIQGLKCSIYSVVVAGVRGEPLPRGHQVGRREQTRQQTSQVKRGRHRRNITIPNLNIIAASPWRPSTRADLRLLFRDIAPVRAGTRQWHGFSLFYVASV